jgi:hypothetical protein
VSSIARVAEERAEESVGGAGWFGHNTPRRRSNLICKKLDQLGPNWNFLESFDQSLRCGLQT